MKSKYKNLGDEQLKQITDKKSLLLHSCCAPCSSSVIDSLSRYFNITILYYNPNIYPYDEYLKRKNEQINFIEKLGGIKFIDTDYDNDIYEQLIKGFEHEPERGSRCTICFKLRLEKTAEIAKKHNFDFFCSTLTVSPYKNSILINEIGKKLSHEYNIAWLYSDFKKNDGYKKSIELSKQYDLYRQDYCGCIYSK